MQKRLAELLGKQVKYAMDCIGDEAKTVANELKNGEVCILCSMRGGVCCCGDVCLMCSVVYFHLSFQIAILENVRFHKEEEKNDPEFAKAVRPLKPTKCCG